jgi:predicted nucleic acid-binding Zn ribbon protein
MSPEHSPQSVATLPSDVPVYCPICQAVPLHGKQTVCSARCRIQRSMGRRERDARLRLLLRTVMDSARDATQLLEEP